MKTKQCTRCKSPTVLAGFNHNKDHKDGLKSECRICEKVYRDSRKDEKAAKQKIYYEANREDYAAKGKVFRTNNKEKIALTSRAKHLLVSYGLTMPQHKQMYLDQDGCCLLCDKSTEYSKIHTDHDHKTGQVRGLLCARCNLGMCFVDDLEWLGRALDYA